MVIFRPSDQENKDDDNSSNKFWQIFRLGKFLEFYNLLAMKELPFNLWATMMVNILKVFSVKVKKISSPKIEQPEYGLHRSRKVATIDACLGD